jgi:hypothetical protein
VAILLSLEPGPIQSFVPGAKKIPKMDAVGKITSSRHVRKIHDMNIMNIMNISQK